MDQPSEHQSPVLRSWKQRKFLCGIIVLTLVYHWLTCCHCSSSEKAPVVVPAAAPAAAPAPAATPAYPTSSRSGPKNWDQFGADENSDDEKDVNLFFKKLYKGATPEQQRAMMKSFTESNGTSLSTNWDDVKGKKVETVPPEGVEAKKW